MEQKDISTLSVQELESLFFKTFQQGKVLDKELEIAKRNIEVIERLIQEKSQAPKEEEEVKDPT